MGSISIRAELVVQILDELTGQPVISGGKQVKLQTEQGKLPLEKGNGYYVFLHPVELRTLFRIEVWGYRTQEVRLEEQDVVQGIWRIYMEPDKQYPISKGCYSLFGKGKPGEERILICHPDGSLGLRSDYTAGEEMVSLYIRTGTVLIEKNFQIREQEQMEFLSLSKAEEKDSCEYRLTQPLQESYHVRQAAFYPVKRVTVDEQGEFFCYWHRSKEGKPTRFCEIWTPEGQKLETLELEAGKRVRLHD